MPILVLGALLTDLLLANAPRRGKRPDLPMDAWKPGSSISAPAPQPILWWLIWCSHFLLFFAVARCLGTFFGRNLSPGQMPNWLFAGVQAVGFTVMTGYCRSVNRQAGRAQPAAGPPPSRRMLFAGWFITFNVVLGLGTLLHSFTGRPTWPHLAFYALAVPTTLLICAYLVRRSRL